MTPAASADEPPIPAQNGIFFFTVTSTPKSPKSSLSAFMAFITVFSCGATNTSESKARFILPSNLSLTNIVS